MLHYACECVDRSLTSKVLLCADIVFQFLARQLAEALWVTTQQNFSVSKSSSTSHIASAIASPVCTIPETLAEHLNNGLLWHYNWWCGNLTLRQFVRLWAATLSLKSRNFSFHLRTNNKLIKLHFGKFYSTTCLKISLIFHGKHFSFQL